MRNDLTEHFRALTAIHAAPQWLWPALVRALLEGKGLTVEQVRAQVVRLKGTKCWRESGGKFSADADFLPVHSAIVG
jgi:hypothetical protein